MPQPDASTVSEALSSYQRVLADKYAAAVQERNQALERENRLAQRLTECLREIEELKTKSQASKGRTIASAAIEVETDATDGSESGSESVLGSKTHAASPCSYRACVLWRLAEPDAAADRREALSDLQRFFCDACDDLLHFDDLGVREDRHFRVSVPATATATAITTALPSLADDSKTSRPATVPAALPHDGDRPTSSRSWSRSSGSFVLQASKMSAVLPMLMLDGAQATELEKDARVDFNGSKLWSAGLLLDQHAALASDVVVDVHAATSSQARTWPRPSATRRRSLVSSKRGHAQSESDMERFYERSVELAVRGRDSAWSQVGDDPARRRPLIAREHRAATAPHLLTDRCVSLSTA
ncbi:hypothetical protein PINS_up018801 [Pythium insidiosum]|nr:hypothetical protein PINS_up018801 [Pythium insidiosum]